MKPCYLTLNSMCLKMSSKESTKKQKSCITGRTTSDGFVYCHWDCPTSSSKMSNNKTLGRIQQYMRIFYFYFYFPPHKDKNIILFSISE